MMKVIVRIFLYPLFMITIVLSILEITIRWTGNYKTYSENIGQNYTSYYNMKYDTWYWLNRSSDTFFIDHGDFEFKYITNSLGLREKELEWNESSSIRVATFGDSFTEGVGATYDSTWPRALERQLLNDGYSAEVINAGVNGSDPFYAYQLLKDHIIKLDPTHVIFSCNRSDIDDYLFRSGFDRFQDDGTVVNRRAPKVETMYKNSHLVRMYLEKFRGYDKTLIRKNNLYEKKIEAIEDINNCLDSTMKLCEMNNIKFIAIAHATPLVFCYDRVQYLDVRLFNKMQNDYTYLYLEEQFRNNIQKENCYDYGWKNDGHFTGKGYTLMGNLIYDEIQSNWPVFFNSHN